jgi:hypothetical protein
MTIPANLASTLLTEFFMKYTSGNGAIDISEDREISLKLAPATNNPLSVTENGLLFDASKVGGGVNITGISFPRNTYVYNSTGKTVLWAITTGLNNVAISNGGSMSGMTLAASGTQTGGDESGSYLVQIFPAIFVVASGGYFRAVSNNVSGYQIA